MSNSIFISAGEASGEIYGAQLMEALRRKGADAGFFGLGGDRMRAAGCDIVTDSRQMAVVGLVEVVKHLPDIRREFNKLLAEIDKRGPSVAVLIDFPEFNFRLARQLHKRGIPVVYFVSPQIWAWRKGRIRLVQKFVQKMLVIFPFEEQFYREHGVEVEYVGHPLADLPRPTAAPDPAAPSIALLPGSRKQEVERNLPEMVRTAELLGTKYTYLLPVASTLDAGWVDGIVKELTLKSKVTIKLCDDARTTLAQSRAAIVASGTATVEAALMGNPFVVVYRLAPLTWTLGRPLVSLDTFAMVNLIAGRKIVPELIQKDFTAEKVIAELSKLLPEGPARTQMMADLADVRKKLHPSNESETAADRAADATLKVLQKR